MNNFQFSAPLDMCEKQGASTDEIDKMDFAWKSFWTRTLNQHKSQTLSFLHFLK